jgi:two-component system response regulator GlrR
LVVDDDRVVGRLIGQWLAEEGCEVIDADSGEAALGLLAADRPDLVISDLVMDGIDGIQLLREIHLTDPAMPVVITSGQAGIPDAVVATRLGATDFLTKPIARDALIRSVQEAVAMPTSAPARGADLGGAIVFGSRIMAELVGRASRVAAVDTRLLIIGETGTGKELLARSIHSASRRAGARFVSVRCSALPDSLAELDVPGLQLDNDVEGGVRANPLLQSAHGGTLFLDEIGDAPPATQALLLRLLQVLKAGWAASGSPGALDVRIIAATRLDLEAMVARGALREDLFYQLNVVPLHMPSLNDRREDIPLLVDHFLRQSGELHRQPPKHFTRAALERLTLADLPGNVRQLRNLVEQCMLLCPSAVMGLEFVAEVLQQAPPTQASLDEAKMGFERRYLAKVLRAAEGNVSAAARMAGRNRTEFYKLLGRHRLDPARFRAPRMAEPT